MYTWRTQSFFCEIWSLNKTSPIMHSFTNEKLHSAVFYIIHFSIHKLFDSKNLNVIFNIYEHSLKCLYIQIVWLSGSISVNIPWLRWMLLRFVIGCFLLKIMLIAFLVSPQGTGKPYTFWSMPKNFLQCIPMMLHSFRHI